MAMRLAYVLSLVVLLISLMGSASAQDKPRRVALVIGNDNYTGSSLSKLDNPVRDARAIAQLLRTHKFEVEEGYDLNHGAFERLRRRFSTLADGADTALVFYAGHGMEVFEKEDLYNVLAPTDAEIDCETRQHENTIKLDDITRATKGANNQIIILDSCRNNPFSTCKPRRGEAPRGYGFRAPEVKARIGEAILIAYSTAQKAFAGDGKPGEHSPFATQLLKVLEDNPSSKFNPLMNQLVIKVGQETKFEQVPSLTIEGGLLEACLSGEGCTDEIEDKDRQRQIARGVASTAALQVRNGDPVTGMLLALEALPDQKAGVRRQYEVEAERSLYSGLVERREVAVSGHAAAVNSVNHSPDGRSFVSAGGNTVHIADAATGATKGELRHDGVYTAFYAPDGATIATLSIDKTARLWDAGSGAFRQTLRHDYALRSARFTADGSTLLIASSDGTVRLWNTSDGSTRIVLRHDKAVQVLLPSPKGERVLTRAEGNVVRLWDTSSGATIVTLPHDALVNLVFSSDGRMFAVTHRQSAKLYDSDSGALLKTLPHGFTISGTTFTPDNGSLITVSSQDEKARVWDIAGGTERVTLPHDTGVTSVSVSPDGRTIATSSLDNTVRLWDAKSLMPRVGGVLRHEAPVSFPKISSDSRTIASRSDERSLRLWDTVTGRLQGEIRQESPAHAFSLAPDGRNIVTGSEDHSARLWTVAASNSPSLRHETQVQRFSHIADGRLVLTATRGTTRVWDVNNGVEVAALRHDERIQLAVDDRAGRRLLVIPDNLTVRLWDSGARSDGAILRHGSKVTGAAFIGNGETVLTRSEDRAARLWDAATGRLLASLQHEATIRGFNSSRDGLAVLTRSDDKAARLWDARTGALRHVLRHEGQTTSSSFATDGRLLLIRSDDNKIYVWDAVTGGLRTTLPHESTIQQFGFASDGVTVVTRSEDKGVRLWSVATGTILRQELSEQVVSSVSEGRSILVIQNDRTVRLWDATKGSDLAVFRHQQAVRTATASADGQILVTLAEDGVVRVWDMQKGSLLRSLQNDSFVLSSWQSKDATLLVTQSSDGSAGVWDLATGTRRHAISMQGYGVVFAPDNRTIVTRSGDREVRLWPVFATTQDMIDHAKAAVPRCLTKSQREAFGLPAVEPDWCHELNKWPYEANADWWMSRQARRSASGSIGLQRFADPVWAVTKPIAWQPAAPGPASQQPIQVPKGFVTDFGSVPGTFWSSLKPEGDMGAAAVLHDWLYWSQSIGGKPLARAEADEILRLVLESYKITSATATAIHKAAQQGGEAVWQRYAEARKKGEKRLLKRLPDEPAVAWAVYRLRPDTFE